LVNITSDESSTVLSALDFIAHINLLHVALSKVQSISTVHSSPTATRITLNNILQHNISMACYSDINFMYSVLSL